MKFYKEMMRKLTLVGLPFLAITMVYTLVTGAQDCFGQITLWESTSAVYVTPILGYYVLTGVFFALQGFSFLFSRAGSDVYHSLPVKRADLYVSVLLAAATWMGATILLNVLEMLVMLLISGCPFVPAYIPLSILYYFVASMLVFAATAVGCALSGTVITALTSAGVILFLPRFAQFLFARGIVERVPIVGWLDFGALLDPTTNAATGILAMHLRQVYASRLITLPHILYSMAPMLLLLAAGLWLFRRRPSEIAQKGSGGRVWTMITSVLLAFAVMLPVTMNYQRLLSGYGAVLIAAALAVFLVYQLLVSSKIRQMLFALPFFLLSVLGVIGFSALIDTAADRMLNTTPAAGEIESVTFRGYDEKAAEPVYSTLLLQNIAFTDAETKEYVAQALKDAVDEINAGPDYANYDYQPYQVVEPVTIRLTGGGTIKRTIEFSNVDELNALRMKNEEFAESVRQFPPLVSVQHLLVDAGLTQEEEQAIHESYVAESAANNLLSGYYYRERKKDMLADGTYVERGEDQTVTGFTAAGYTGTVRYSDSYSLRLDTPDTVSLLMRTYNAYVEGSPLEGLAAAIERFHAGSAGENDSLSVGITVFNSVDSNGFLVQDSTSFYLNQYTLESEYHYDKVQTDYLDQFVDLLSRAALTDDPSGVFVRLDWYYYDTATVNDDNAGARPTAYLRFETKTDERDFLNLLRMWRNVQRTFY